MKKATLLILFCGIISLGFAQDEKQFVLKNTANLDLQAGTTYTRFELSKEEIRIADSLAAKYVVDITPIIASMLVIKPDLPKELFLSMRITASRM